MSFFIAFVLLTVTINVKPTNAESTFPDAKNHWAKNAIHFLYKNNIVTGLPNGNFGVNDTIKRRDAAVMVARALNLDTDNSNGGNPFKDVQKDSYYYKAVLATVEANIISGYPDGTFKPNDELTREQMAKIITDAYKLKNFGGKVFRDVPPSSWSYNYIQTVISNRISSGTSTKEYSPSKKITRAEFATMIARAEDESFRQKEIVIEDFSSMVEEAHFVIKHYSPEFYDILQSVAKTEGKSIDQIIEQWKRDTLFGTINTAVHEIVHSYQMEDFFTFKNGRIYYTYKHRYNNSPFIVDHQKEYIYFSEKMGKTIPTHLRTMRWDVYVAPGVGNMASNISGAYGILIEYEAYYIGDKAGYNSYDYLRTLPFNRSQWLQYYTSMDGTAFYEFTYFILNYLKYAKTNEPTTYNYIMNESDFKKVFKQVYTNYKNLVEIQHPKRINEMITHLTSMGYHAGYDYPYLRINGAGMAPFTDDAYENVKNELKKDEYQQILQQLLQ